MHVCSRSDLELSEGVETEPEDGGDARFESVRRILGLPPRTSSSEHVWDKQGADERPRGCAIATEADLHAARQIAAALGLPVLSMEGRRTEPQAGARATHADTPSAGQGSHQRRVDGSGDKAGRGFESESALLVEAWGDAPDQTSRQQGDVAQPPAQTLSLGHGASPCAATSQARLEPAGQVDAATIRAMYPELFVPETLSHVGPNVGVEYAPHSHAGLTMRPAAVHQSPTPSKEASYSQVADVVTYASESSSPTIPSAYTLDYSARQQRSPTQPYMHVNASSVYGMPGQPANSVHHPRTHLVANMPLNESTQAAEMWDMQQPSRPLQYTQNPLYTCQSPPLLRTATTAVHPAPTWQAPQCSHAHQCRPSDQSRMQNSGSGQHVTQMHHHRPGMFLAPTHEQFRHHPCSSQSEAVWDPPEYPIYPSCSSSIPVSEECELSPMRQLQQRAQQADAMNVEERRSAVRVYDEWRRHRDLKAMTQGALSASSGCSVATSCAGTGKAPSSLGQQPSLRSQSDTASLDTAQSGCSSNDTSSHAQKTPHSHTKSESSSTGSSGPQTPPTPPISNIVTHFEDRDVDDNADFSLLNKSSSDHVICAGGLQPWTSLTTTVFNPLSTTGSVLRAAHPLTPVPETPEEEDIDIRSPESTSNSFTPKLVPIDQKLSASLDKTHELDVIR